MRLTHFEPGMLCRFVTNGLIGLCLLAEEKFDDGVFEKTVEKDDVFMVLEAKKQRRLDGSFFWHLRVLTECSTGWVRITPNDNGFMEDPMILGDEWSAIEEVS